MRGQSKRGTVVLACLALGAASCGGNGGSDLGGASQAGAAGRAPSAAGFGGGGGSTSSGAAAGVGGVLPPGCQDGDGDGYGVGAECAGPDCDDGATLVHEPLTGYADADGDGTAAGPLQEYCAPSLPTNVLPTKLEDDCAPADPFRERAIEGYADRDRDGQSSSKAEAVCTSGARPSWLLEQATPLVDCNDGRASVYADGPELPGNGLDDDCTAGDAELSDTSAIWVDGNAGQGSDDTGLGTREQPFASLKTATACATQSLGAAHPAKDRCKGTFLVIVLAQTPEDTPYAPPGVPTPISVLGGFRGKANGFAAIPDNPIAAKHPGAARIAGGGLSVATGTRVAFANLEIDAYSVGAPLSSPRAVSLGAGARATILRSDLDARGQSQAYGISADPAGETPTRLVLERSRVFAQGGNYSQGVTPNGAALTVSNSRIDAQGPGYAWAIYVTSTQDTTVSVTRSELSAHDANYCSAIEAANSQVKTPLLVEQSTLRTGGECGYATGVSGAQATRLLVERSVIDLDNENEARSTYGYGVYADRADLVSSVIRLRVANGRCAYMANEAGPTAAVGTLNMIGSVCDVRPRTARIGVEANGPVIILNSAFVGFPETTDYSRASLQVRAAQRLVLAGNVFTHSSCVAAFPDASEPACVSLAELAKCDSAIWPCDADKDLARDNRALADPGFVDGDGTYTSRYGLTSESGLRGAGVSPVTLTDVYADEDLAGALRSEDGSWDSGAREYTATTP